MFDLHLISIWEGNKYRGQYVNPHSHNYPELVYYWHGGGISNIDGNDHSFSDGCFALILPNTIHDELHHLDSHVICLEFSGAENLPQLFAKDQHNIIHSILTDILREAKNQDHGYKDMTLIKLNELYFNIIRSEKTSSSEKNFEYIINYLKENYHEKIVLSNCAKQLNLSYDYFQHKFKKLTGSSPQQFLLKQRLISSRELLLQEDLSCSQIAYRCGFSTAAQYSALFKKEYGVTPLQFRKHPSPERLKARLRRNEQ